FFVLWRPCRAFLGSAARFFLVPPPAVSNDCLSDPPRLSWRPSTLTSRKFSHEKTARARCSVRRFADSGLSRPRRLLVQLSDGRQRPGAVRAVVHVLAGV